MISRPEPTVCVKSYAEANHPPVVELVNALDLEVRPGESVSLSARGTSDPDGDELAFHWWQVPGSRILRRERRNPRYRETGCLVHGPPATPVEGGPSTSFVR